MIKVKWDTGIQMLLTRFFCLHCSSILFCLELQQIALQTAASNNNIKVNICQQPGPSLTCYYPGTYTESPIHLLFSKEFPGRHSLTQLCVSLTPCFSNVVILLGNFYHNHRNGEKRGSSLKRHNRLTTFSDIFYHKEKHKEGSDYHNRIIFREENSCLKKKKKNVRN